jgi:alpha-beta hydrolase superfamily lysophospholipase
MGGLIAIHAAMRCKTSSRPAYRLSGIILSAPALLIDPSTHSLPLRIGASILDCLYPKAKVLTFPPRPSTSFLQVKLHASLDPLNNHQPVSIHQGLELIRGIAEAQKYAPSFDIPILIFHGSKDRHVKISGTHKYFRAITSKDKTFIEMQNIMHEPWQEEREIREPILDAAVMWAVDRLGANSNTKEFDKALELFTTEFQRF